MNFQWLLGHLGNSELTENLVSGHPQTEQQVSIEHSFRETHLPVRYWARLWGFSPKTVREWFRDEYGPGILRQPNIGRLSKRDYTTIMVSPSDAARVYAKRTTKESIH